MLRAPRITLLALAAAASGLAAELSFSIDPVTRYVRVAYDVPAQAPGELEVRAEVSQGGSWRPASVWAHVSETALALMPESDWEHGIARGVVKERHAAGLRRQLWWNPFLQEIVQGAAPFRITLLDGARRIARQEGLVAIDNRDVVVLDDWSQTLQKHEGWWFRTGQQGPRAPWRGSSLETREKGVELKPLTYPLRLSGPYAIFVSLPAKLGAIELRLSGDERFQIFTQQRLHSEAPWKQADLTRQHLIIGQPYRTVFEYEDEFRAHLGAVRLVPLPAKTQPAAAPGEPRLVAGYFEPYSWAFYEKIESNLQHWEPLLAFGEAGVHLIDIQLGRGGSKMNHETRVGDALIAETFGDPIRGKVPRTSNVGRMQQYTNTLATELKYARLLGLRPFANIGATNAYPGTPLEADISRQHPEWRIGSHLRYEIPEVRQHMLRLFEEALEVGAEGVSIDWCRYPNSVRSPETVTGFFRELRRLADRFARTRGRAVEILTRFPARGVPGWQYMDYAAWAREGLVDYLAPSNIQGRHMNFSLREYLDAVRGTRARLLPCADALHWGLAMPGMWLERILHQYEQGAAGVYIYQADAPVLDSPQTRRYVQLAGSLTGLRQWRRREEAEQASYSKGLYITAPQRDGKYQRWGRLRVWVEGFPRGKVELLVDGRMINRYEQSPYILTSEERADDASISAGKHALRVRAWDGTAWLEREFAVEVAE